MYIIHKSRSESLLTDLLLYCNSTLKRRKEKNQVKEFYKDSIRKESSKVDSTTVTHQFIVN